MNNVTEMIAENIKCRRKALRLTQSELGALLGYSEKAISKWESGKGTPPTVILPRLAFALKTDVNRLLTEADEKNYYLGIDGGGTKTEFALANADGEIIRTCMLGTSNPSDIGTLAASEVLRAGIAEICADIPRTNVSLFAGIAGGTTAGVKEELTAFLNKFGFAKVQNGSDAENAIAASLGTDDGITVIMGTGSVTFAQKQKKLYRVGGYGYLLGDAGSGFALGRDAILAALQYEDGSGAPTALYDLVKELCGTDALLPKLGMFYEGGKRKIASFAQTIFAAYKANDPLAKAILHRNLEEVAKTISGATGHLEEMPASVVLCGGISQNYGDIILPILQDVLTDTQKYKLSLCRHSMIYGALTLAGMPTDKKEKTLC